MDPNAALAEMRELAHSVRSSSEAWDADRLAELVQALDEWLTGGGFLPKAWGPARRPRRFTDEEQRQMARERLAGVADKIAAQLEMPKP